MWREVVFVVEREAVEPWCDALLTAGALSVQAEDADADSPDEQALFGEPGLPAPVQLGWQRTRLAALLAGDADHRAVLDAAAQALGVAPPLDLRTRTFDDQDWVRLSQSQFEAIPIGERLLITPSWIEPPADAEPPAGASRADASRPDEVPRPGAPPPARQTDPAARPARLAITLDPGLAFGTGSHPTTRMCLLWLERHLRTGQRLIDYGCGSGILAIAALRLGAAPVVAVDIDPQALTATRANAAVNRASLQVQDVQAPIGEPADVVVANILATPLKLLAPLLQSLVKPGGALVLAGLLERQVDEVAGCYREVPLSVFACEEGWACLAGHKSA
ncbi:MAG TPA: 50S ribosomal protein L11 methyltransferase [Burkholderiaceae bacterium]|nr:50S ribosomal protein L11 methyltransferase [Burkholderiaceae bacterium]